MLSLLDTHRSHTNHLVHNLFTLSSNHTTFKLQRTRIKNMQFAVYISDTSVTLTQSEGHQTYSNSVNPKQGYNHKKFERSCFNGVQEKAKFKGFFFFQMRKYVN